MKLLVTLLTALIVTGCAGINVNPATVIQKATVVTAALNLRDSYLDARDVIAGNLSKFSEADQEIIIRESRAIESFYKTVSGLDKNDKGELIADIDTIVFLSTSVRVSAQNLSDVIKRNLELLDTADRATVSNAVRNFQIVDADVTRTLSVGNRQAKKEALLQLIQTTTSLALAVSSIKS